MRPFVLNGDVWRPVLVDRDDPRLIDRTGTSRLATTDPSTMCVYLSNGLLDSLHAIIPEDTWVNVEEWVCNYLANRGREIIHAANTALGRNVPVIK